MFRGVSCLKLELKMHFHRNIVTHFGKSSLVLLEVYNSTDKFCVKESDYPENPTIAFILEG